MSHLPLIAAAYVLGVLTPLAYAVAAAQRVMTARRKLAAIDPRSGRARAAELVAETGQRS